MIGARRVISGAWFRRQDPFIPQECGMSTTGHICHISCRTTRSTAGRAAVGSADRRGDRGGDACGRCGYGARREIRFAGGAGSRARADVVPLPLRSHLRLAATRLSWTDVWCPGAPADARRGVDPVRPDLAGGVTFFGAEREGNVSPIGLGLVVGGPVRHRDAARGPLRIGHAVRGRRRNTLLVVTLFIFICSSVLGTLHLPMWTSDAITLGTYSQEFGRFGFPCGTLRRGREQRVRHGPRSRVRWRSSPRSIGKVRRRRAPI